MAIKTKFSIISPSKDRRTYQLSKAKSPQNREMTLFSLMLQELIYVMSINIREDISNGMVLSIPVCPSFVCQLI